MTELMLTRPPLTPAPPVNNRSNYAQSNPHDRTNECERHPGR